MSDISENLLSAISTVINGELKNLKFDKTIEATIRKFVDADTGEYKVYYEGATFSAFSNDLAVVYEQNDRVLVKIPEGDMTKKKSIEGKVSDNLSYKEKNKLAKFVANVGPSFDKLFDYDASSKRGIIAGVSNPLVIFDAEESEPSELAIANLLALGEENDKLRLTAKFSTALRNAHIKGNYGLRVYFDINEYNEAGEQVIKQVYFTLDLGSFIGSPYTLTNPTPQTISVEVKKNYLQNLRKIEFFNDNFDVDHWTELVKQKDNTVKEVDVYNTTVPNLFVEDIQLGYVAVYDLSDDLYHLVIDAPDGLVIGDEDIDLVGALYYAGHAASPSSSFWFRANPSVTVGSSLYSKDAGAGWEKCGEGDTYTVTPEQVPYKKSYKYIAVYNGLTYTDTIEIRKLNSEYEYKIIQNTDKSNITLSVVKIKDDAQINVATNWFLEADGNYESLTTTETDEPLVINSYLTHAGVHFVAKTSDGIKLETVINNISSKDNLSVTFIGTETHQYDANGDIDIDNQESEKTLTPTIAWSEGYGTSYTLKWYQGNKLLNETPTLENESSMMYNLYIEDNVLHYKIKAKFDPNATDNIITLKVITSGNVTFAFDKEIIFLKEGDQGTNGTTYSVVIRPTDGTNRLTGFYPVFAGEKDQLNYAPAYSDWQYKAYVYRDGQPFEGEIKYEWYGTNVDFIKNGVYRNIIKDYETNSVKVGRVFCGPSTINYLVKLVVTITDSVDSTKKIILYNNYPIQVVFGNTEIVDDTNAEQERKKYVVNIPSSIQYNASGYIPVYANQALRVGYETIVRRAIGYYEALNEDVLTLTSKGYDVTYLNPAVMFNFDKGTGSLKCRILGESHYIIYTIIMYLNTFGNEAINGWDGTSIVTDNGSVLAPQIGAGTKNEENEFTGVIMGKDTAQGKIGLYGYQDGISSFGLTEEGKAFFGRSGNGRIEIDGNEGTIEGGGGGESSDGMTIKLNSGGELNTYGIQLGGNNFYVTYGGMLHSTKGEIGGWTIDDKELSSYSRLGDPGVHLFSEDQREERAIAGSQAKTDWRIAAGSSFGVDNDGNLYANSGFIGGWKINDSSLTSVGIGTTTTLYAKNQDTATNICGHSANDWRIAVGNVFGVDSSGWMHASHGTIAGWDIDGDNIYKNNGSQYTYLNASASGSTSLNSSAPGSTSFRSDAESQYQITTTSLKVSGNSWIAGSTIKDLDVGSLTIAGNKVNINEKTFISDLSISGKKVKWNVYFSKVVTDISKTLTGYKPVYGLTDWSFNTVESLSASWKDNTVYFLNSGKSASKSGQAQWTW